MLQWLKTPEFCKKKICVIVEVEGKNHIKTCILGVTSQRQFKKYYNSSRRNKHNIIRYVFLLVEKKDLSYK